MQTLRYTHCGGWSGRRTRPFADRVVWSVRLKRPSRPEDLGLLNHREVKGMVELLTLPLPPLLPAPTCLPGETLKTTH